MTKLGQKNESSKLSFANPFDAVFEQVKGAGINVVSERLAQKANELYKDKPFGLEYKGVYMVTDLVAKISSLISFASALFALQTVLFWIVGLYVSWIGSFLLCGLIEVLKTQIWGKTAKNFNVYKRVGVLGISSLIGLHILSLVSSGYGAYLIPSQFAAPAPVLDSFAHQTNQTILSEAGNLDAQILGLDAQISKQSSLLIKPNGEKSSSTAKELSKLNAQKSELQAQKREALARVEQMQKDHKTQSEIKGKETQSEVLTLQYIAVGVAVLFEFLYILCTLFGFYFMFRVYVDTIEPETQTPENSGKMVKNSTPESREAGNPKIGQSQIPQIAPPVNIKPPKIGFKFYDANGGIILPTCVNCGLEFLPNHQKQKYCTTDCKERFRSKKAQNE
jgi:Na+-transporting methylmalonyl-CoA/oxaloacetate decarboxylase gamma subunit